MSTKMRGSDIAKMRQDLRMTQEQFAERIGISRSHLARVESKDELLSKSFAFSLDQLLKSDGSKENPYLIPYYDTDVTSAPMEIFDDQTSYEPTAKLDLPGFRFADFAVNIAGDSMYPTISGGSMVICKEVKDKSIIMYGEVYLVVTVDYRMVKRLKKSTRKGYVLACSDNHNGHDETSGKTYADIELPVDKITHLYLVKGSIKRHQL